jgi:predicted RNA-binding Zn-ribbon protein involved in translation (DUF1610 family)
MYFYAVFCAMADAHHNCGNCGRSLDYHSTKHNGCPGCGRTTLHGAD